MTSMDEVEAYEHSQARVMEFLIQQCVTTTREADTIAASSTNASQCDNATANATIMDLLAQTCADANAAVHELSVEEMADGLARAVYSTQKILRSVGQNVSTILQDSEQMQELCDHVKQTDTNVLETLRPSSMPLEETSQGGDSVNDAVVIVASDAKSSEAIISFDEENVRTIMVFAETMCTTMDHALSTITKEEMDLAAQLSLNIAQKLLHAGQSLFTSLGDDERRKARAGDRSDRITIEEVADKDDQEKDGRLNSQQVKSAAVLRMCVTDLYTRTREMAVEHPFLAGVSIAAGLPFIGLAIPVASLVALALLIEKHYPEHAKLTLELCSNFVQMSKLWFLLLKIGARQVSVVARECIRSWYEYASMNGFMATGLELASTGCSLGYFGASYLYQRTVCLIQQAFQ